MWIFSMAYISCIFTSLPLYLWSKCKSCWSAMPLISADSTNPFHYVRSHENFDMKCKCQVKVFNGLFEMFSNMTNILIRPWKLLLKHVSLYKHNQRTKASSSFESIFMLTALIIYILNNKFQSLNRKINVDFYSGLKELSTSKHK